MPSLTNLLIIGAAGVPSSEDSTRTKGLPLPPAPRPLPPNDEVWDDDDDDDEDDDGDDDDDRGTFKMMTTAMTLMTDAEKLNSIFFSFFFLVLMFYCFP